MLLFLQLYLAHLIGDFLLQSDRIAKNKREASALAAHAGIHVALACLIVNIGLSRRVVIAVILLALVHALFDYTKARLSKDTWVAFAVDQACHLLAVAGASVWLAAPDWSSAAVILRAIAKTKWLYLYLCAYVAVVFGGGFFVQKVTQSFLERIGDGVATLKPGLPNAGKYIGWIERLLILTFVIGHYGEAVGFLLAAKALARYPEIKDDTKGHFAEYFLVGTLTSVGLALVGGVVVLKLRPLLL